MIVAFTGHRPHKLGGYGPSPIQTAVRSALRSTLTELSPRFAISGMALGVDQWAAEVCVELGIPFIAAIPFAGQESRWPEASRRAYAELLAKAAGHKTVSPGGYFAWKMQTRNEWMVDHCSTLVAVWDGTSGGTANCVAYAQRIGRRVVRIAPGQLVEIGQCLASIPESAPAKRP